MSTWTRTGVRPGRRGIGEVEPGGVHRERVRKRRAFQQRERRSFVISRRRRRGVANGPISLACEYLSAGTMHLDLDRAELAVEGRVPRRVGQEIVELVVLVDALERGPEIVRSARRGNRRCPRPAAQGPLRESSFIVSSTRSNAIVSG